MGIIKFQHHAPLYSVHFVDKDHGWAVGGEGTIISTATGGVFWNVPPDDTVVDDFILFQNYPNPFNSTTTFEFQINRPSKVSLKIFNTLGEELETLINNQVMEGNSKVVWDATKYSSGIYFYKLQSDNFYQVKKCVLIK